MTGESELYRVNVQLVKMPCKIKASVTANDDNSYTVFLNTVHSHETLKQAAKHELEHIQRGDIFCKDSADKIECQVRRNSRW